MIIFGSSSLTSLGGLVFAPHGCTVNFKASSCLMAPLARASVSQCCEWTRPPGKAPHPFRY
eukprot:2375088-Amphidinium_carterae.2